jgi:hypothetical protein
MQGIIAGQRRRIAGDARHHLRTSLQASPAMQGIISGHPTSIGGDASHHLRTSKKDRARCKASSPDIQQASPAMHHIISGIEEGSRAMQGIISGHPTSISGDASHHLRTSKKDRARCKASSPDIQPASPAMHRIISGHPYEHRRRCVAASLDIVHRSRAMHDIIAGHRRRIAGDASHDLRTSNKDRRRCMTSSPATLLPSCAMLLHPSRDSAS